MSTGALLALQVLTNLAIVPASAGVPRGWTLQRVRDVEAPQFQVTGGHALRVEARRAAGGASYRLRAPLHPPTGHAGTLKWRWRTDTPIRGASLRVRARDDAPVRVVVTFDDGRSLAYSWANSEGRSESWLSGARAVVVLERADDADGSWHVERRDPFADYRRLFSRAPHPIVAVGVSADTDRLGGRAVAEAGDFEWEP